MNRTTFEAAISKEDNVGGWTFVGWPESVSYLGTGKAAKVSARIDGHEFNVTCLPKGDGTHFLPLNKAVLKAIGRSVGEKILIEIWKEQ
jgi:hypothetical protein